MVRVERVGGITTVILDRPAAKNAVDRDTAEQLAAAFRAFDADASSPVAVLYGDHGTFCAGADLKALASGTPNRVAPDGDGPMGPSRMILSKPVIAAIAGHAVAVGLDFALWCDLRVAEADAVLGVFCRRFGVPLIDGGTIRLPRLIGLSRALDCTPTGRAGPADEALAIGLVNRVVPAGESRAAAEQLARELAALPQAALRADRTSAYLQHDLALPAALQQELELLLQRGRQSEIVLQICARAIGAQRGLWQCGELARELLGGGARLARGHDPVDEPDRERFVGGPRAAGGGAV